MKVLYLDQFEFDNPDQGEGLVFAYEKKSIGGAEDNCQRLDKFELYRFYKKTAELSGFQFGEEFTQRVDSYREFSGYQFGERKKAPYVLVSDINLLPIDVPAKCHEALNISMSSDQYVYVLNSEWGAIDIIWESDDVLHRLYWHASY